VARGTQGVGCSCLVRRLSRRLWAGSSVAEQGTFNPLVVGSNPTRLAMIPRTNEAAGDVPAASRIPVDALTDPLSRSARPSSPRQRGEPSSRRGRRRSASSRSSSARAVLNDLWVGSRPRSSPTPSHAVAAYLADWLVGRLLDRGELVAGGDNQIAPVATLALAHSDSIARVARIRGVGYGGVRQVHWRLTRSVGMKRLALIATMVMGCGAGAVAPAASGPDASTTPKPTFITYPPGLLHHANRDIAAGDTRADERDRRIPGR
jgi:hypothetical protein